MLTVFVSVKIGAVSKKVEVALYNVKDVGKRLGITPVAVVVAARKAGVGCKDAGSLFFTEADIAVLGKRSGRGRPGLNGMPKGWEPPKREGELMILGIPTNLEDIASGELIEIE